MKRLLLVVALALTAGALFYAHGRAQQPAPPPAKYALAKGTISIHELPSNQESKVETDRFLGLPDRSYPKMRNGLLTRSMMRGGDPYKPGALGAVLEYRDDLSVATLEPHAQSASAPLDEISIYYVQGGAGSVDTGPGTTSYPLHPGVGVLIAPGVIQHFVNTGDTQLSMISLTWKNNDGMTVKQPIRVVDTSTEPANGGREGGHWGMSSRAMFDMDKDGINITAFPVYVLPNTYTAPHSHSKGIEEIWVKTGFDLGYAILGSEIRKIDGPGVILAPPNGLTVHSSMNPNQDRPAIWLYLSRRIPHYGEDSTMPAGYVKAVPANANPVPRGMEGRPIGGNVIPIHEHPSNQASGVEIDHWVGTPGTAFTKVWNGLLMRSMLRAGNPYEPAPAGDVLEYRDDLSVATLPAHFQSGVTASDEITFYYVQGGEGSVDMGPGTPSYPLHTGVGVLYAPGAKQHFVSTGDQPLSMIMMSWTKNDGMKVKVPLKVVDTTTKPMGGNRAHWDMIGGQGMFNNDDGVNATMSVIHMPPMSYSGPHAHTKGVEEIWVKTGFDTGYAILGSEMRKIDGPGAFLAPPNGLTTHSSMNLNEDHAGVWLYLSRRAPNDPAAQ